MKLQIGGKFYEKLMNFLNFHLFFICLIRYCNRINNKTIIGYGLRRVSRIIQTSINVVCLSLRQITLTPVGKFCIPAQPHPIIVHYCTFIKQLLRIIFDNFEGHISNANTVHEFGKYSGNANEYVFINHSISAPGDYKLYSLEHSSTAILLKLPRYRKPPNIRPGVIFVGKDFLMGLYNRGGGGLYTDHIWC